jgi:hypothetical protein
VDLRGLSATRAGSTRDVFVKAYVTRCPNPVMVSSIATLNVKRRRIAAVFTHVTVVLMVLGYITLYLGLRASEWWASLRFCVPRRLYR